MANNLKIEGNYFVVTNTVTSVETIRFNRAKTRFYVDGSDNYYFLTDTPYEKQLSNETFAFSDFIDNRTGSAFTSVAALNIFLSNNTGGEIYDSHFIAPGTTFIFVSLIDDLPTAVSNVITLEDDTAYYFVNNIDLLGDRLVGGSNTTILGSSSETSSITSTGLGASTPLFTTEWTTPVRHITFKDVGTAIDIDGTVNDIALDWTGVNFNNVDNIGTIDSCDNFIFSKGAFIDSANLNFTGTVGTIGIDNSLLQGTGAVENIISLDASTIVTRRFRIIYSAIVAFSSTTALNVSASATIPVEGYILDTVNFSGGGTYLAGLDHTDNETLFKNNVGIVNSNEISQYYMNNNATATTIAATGTPVKVAGTTTSASVTQKFTNTDNRATYNGAITRYFKITAVLSLESGNNNQVGIYIAKNGTVITESEVYVTTNGSGRAEAAFCQALVETAENDYYEIFVENNTSTTDVTVTDLNVIID